MIILNKEYDVIIVGAGPAGIMAGIQAAFNGYKVVIIEKNNKILIKLMITGKGRCNLTNNCDIDKFIESVPSNGRFLYSAINSFTPQDVMNFFETYGLNLKTERGNRVFPQSDKALDVVDSLYKLVKISGCSLLQGRVNKIVIKENRIEGVLIENSSNVIRCKNVIIACGGMSYPKTGSTGDGYKLAKQAGHSIKKLMPSLVPLISDDEFCKDLQGLSLKNISIRVECGDKIVYEDFGELLFTHFGLSGPVILSASAHMKEIENKKYVIKIDLKPSLSIEKLDKRIQNDLLKNKNKEFKNALNELFPKKLIPVIVRLSKINENKKCNVITKEERLSFANLIKNFKVNIKGFRPIEEAIVTSGGVNVKEINPKTMESKLCKGLFFAGEVIDVDGYTGGFNLQIAFATGFLAGNSINL